MKNSLKLIWHILKTYPLESLTTICLLLLTGILDGVGIMLIVPLISTLTKESEGVSTLEVFARSALDYIGIAPDLGPMLALLVGVVTFAALVKFSGGVQIGLVTSRIGKILRFRLMEAIIRAGWGYSSQVSPGQVNAALGIETESAASVYSVVGKMIASGWQVIIGLIIASAISIHVTLGGIAFGVITAVMFSTFVTRTRTTANVRKDAMKDLSTRIVEVISALKSIKAMGEEDRFLRMLEIPTDAVRSAIARLTIYERVIGVLPEPIAALAMAIMLYVYVGVLEGSLETALALAVLFSRSAVAIRIFQRAYQSLVRQEPSHQFIYEMIDNAEAAVECFPGRKNPHFEQSIALRDLTVIYDDKERPALHDVSLHIPATGMVTIAGPSGAGKSTLVNAIAGIERPYSGDVLVDDVPLLELDMAKWRQKIGYVPQEIFLFPDSVKENVSLGAGEGDGRIDDEAVIEALQAAEAWTFVQALPKGIDTPLGQAGSKLSGGERQRISLARALARKPRLLILDEPTAALDEATERDVCRTLRHIASEIVVLVISHKQALAAAADIVFQLEGGKVVNVYKGEVGADLDAEPDNASSNRIVLAGATEAT
jgi:ATP-binding cassette, subfamily C, bacterial